MDGWMVRLQMDGWMDEWMDGWMNHQFANPFERAVVLFNFNCNII